MLDKLLDYIPEVIALLYAVGQQIATSKGVEPGVFDQRVAKALDRLSADTDAMIERWKKSIPT